MSNEYKPRTNKIYRYDELIGPARERVKEIHKEQALMNIFEVGDQINLDRERAAEKFVGIILVNDDRIPREVSDSLTQAFSEYQITVIKSFELIAAELKKVLGTNQEGGNKDA